MTPGWAVCVGGPWSLAALGMGAEWGRGIEEDWRLAEEVDCMELWQGASFQPHLEQPHFLLVSGGRFHLE